MLTRQWRLVQALHGLYRGKTPSSLTKELGITRSTLYRDLKVLEQAGVPLDISHENGEARYRLEGTQLPPLAPSALQLAALQLARSQLHALEGTALVHELDSLLARWDHRSTAELGLSLQSASSPASTEDVERIDQAIRRGRRARFRYRGARDAHETFRFVDPVALRYAGGHLYLIAWDHDREDWRTFKSTRIHHARISPEPADEHPPFDEVELFAGSVKAWSGDPVNVLVRLSPDVASRAHEWPLIADQQLEHSADGSALVHARVAGITEALRWVLSWGAAAEALEPTELREAVREELAGALSHYGPKELAKARERAGNGPNNLESLDNSSEDDGA
jgi:predicted DNA-binding transcriptional regulator YafY